MPYWLKRVYPSSIYVIGRLPDILFAAKAVCSDTVLGKRFK